MTRTPASLYISNWSLREPLCQSQTVPYLRSLAASGYRSCLMTFERAPYAVPAAERRQVGAELASQGICWHPLSYHRRSSLLAAAYDGARAIGTAVAAVLSHRPRIIHTRTSVPAGIGLIVARLCGRRFLYDADSELSAEYVDGGYWTTGSLAYRLLSRVEKACRRRADAVIVLTERMRRDMIARGVRVPVTVIPCCVDVDRFRFDAARRDALRRSLGLGQEKLLVYVGKTGPRYMVREMCAFVRAAAADAGPLRLLVVTHDEPGVVRDIAAAAGLDPAALIVTRATDAEVPGWLWAADAALAFIRPAPSEQGASPIKVSEYLAAGLPVVMTSGIGDLSEAVDVNGLGVVVPEQTPAAARDAAARLKAMWLTPGAVRDRCAGWARSALDVETTAVKRYVEVYSALLSPLPGPEPCADGSLVRGIDD